MKKTSVLAGAFISSLVILGFIPNGYGQNNDTNLMARLNGADIVVVGKVVKVEEAVDLKYERIIFGDPYWHRATIKVKSTLKGKHEKKITVYLPKSSDVLWKTYHRFVKGQKGIWILRHESHGIFKAKGQINLVNLLVAPRQTDYQPTSQLRRIKTLLSGK